MKAEPVVKYCYAALRCKTCSALMIIKYLGIADGKAIHTLVSRQRPCSWCSPCPANRAALSTSTLEPTWKRSRRNKPRRQTL